MVLPDSIIEMPRLSYQQFGNLVGNLTDMIVKEQNWQPMIDEIWNNCQVSDYSGKSAKIADSYEDFVGDAYSGFLDKHITE